MKKLIYVLEKVEKYLIVLAYITMTLIIFIQVINRNLLHLSVGWFEELARYCMITVIMFSAEVCFRTNDHMRLQIFIDKLPKSIKIGVERFNSILIIAFSMVISVGALQLVKAVAQSAQRTPGLHIPMAVPYFAILIPFIVIAVGEIFRFFTINKREDKGGIK